MTDNDKIDLGGIAKLYTDSLEKHGAASQGVGWRDPQSHLLRFRKLAEVIDAPDESVSINDLGCGYGALYNFLVERGKKLSAYYGYDISEKMLDEARARVTSPAARFIHSDKITEQADYTIASGIFNVRLDMSEAQWQNFILGVLAEIDARSTRGFAFNLLTSYVDWKEPHLYYGDPSFFFNYCRLNFSRRVALYHDYPLWEWTIVVRK